MSDIEKLSGELTPEAEQLRALGYEQQFDRKMGLWSNFALGFLYLSPLVGVFSLFAPGVSTGGPVSIYWMLIVGAGQFLVTLVFGEVVSQYPLAGGLYQWGRRLWNGRYAWILSWIYVFAVIVAITTTALFSPNFVVALFSDAQSLDSGAGPLAQALIAVGMIVVCLLLNVGGTKALSQIAKVGLVAELSGVILVGLYLLLFNRHQPFSVFFDTLGAGADGEGYVWAFLGSSIVGLVLCYGFEACGEVAEEVPNPGRRIPLAMQLTVVVGSISAFFSFAGYLLAAPDLPAIVSGDIGNPIPAILFSSLGVIGTKIFLVVALISFIACVMGQQAAASRLVYSFARDNMFPGSQRFAKMSQKRRVPLNALVAVNVLPIFIIVFVYFQPDSLLRIAAFQVLAVYCAFQMVVFASLRMRLKGWRPAGQFALGRAGTPITIGALIYGVLAMVLLAMPTGDGPFYDQWIALIGFAVVAGVGLVYLFTRNPDRNKTGPEGDAIEVAERMRETAAASRPGGDAGSRGRRSGGRAKEGSQL
ncbi:APC family permease [Streptomyces sp. NPDC003442]